MPEGHTLEHVAIARQVLETWDADTRAKATEQARSQGAGRDVEAQMMLEAHIMASSAVVQEADVHSTRFNAMALYARVGKFYGFLSDAEMHGMDYVRFYGYLREMNVLIEERNAATRQAQQGMVDDPELAHLMLRKQFGGKPHQYTGETLTLND